MANSISVLNHAADNIRILAAAAVEKAKSGHPGGAMGGADFINVLYSEYLKYDPKNPEWVGRDRFFLDPGHMAPMLYSQLCLAGKFTLDELAQLRQWGSPTTGHPEFEIARGIENTSGPLGQGHVFAIGAAIAAKFLAAHTGNPTFEKETIYAYISDGGVQEEISQGGARIAATLVLDNLIMFYDSNDIQLSTETKEVMSEDTAAKYRALGWEVIEIVGNDEAQIRCALDAAQKAITASGKRIIPVSSFMGTNSVDASNVMWGAQIVSDQTGMYASFFAHMSTGVSYGANAPKQISSWLYSKMSPNDDRRAWWDPDQAYLQQKFDFIDLQTWTGDYIWMRVEEMYLNAAEAACQSGNDALAKQYLMELMSKRDASYNTNKTGKSLDVISTHETGSLLEEIVIQRRIELWGEDGRIYTLRRLHQGFERPSAYGWPSGLLLPTHTQAMGDPASYLWVLTIPQAEFDGNQNMDPSKDQNPIGDYPE